LERKDKDNSDLLEILMKDPRFQEMILNKLAERQKDDASGSGTGQASGPHSPSPRGLGTT
jgi:hypothetical protein